MSIQLALIIILVLICICMVAIFWRLIIFYWRFGTVRLPRMLMSNMNISPGDIIFFVGNVHGPIISIFSETYFGHLGIVIRENNELYLSETQPGLEIAPKNEYNSEYIWSPNILSKEAWTLYDRREIDYQMKPGSVKVPLITRLHHYSGLLFIMPLSTPIDESRLLEAANTTLQYPYPTALEVCKGLLGMEMQSRHCYQHVSHILNMMDLSPKLSVNNVSGVCKQLCQLANKEIMLDGKPNKYLPPIQLIYNL